MASGRQVEYSLRLNSNASATLMADSAAANKFDNSMWQVQKTLASFGLGLGAHYLIDAAKDWTQAAADYEQAMLRIKNASKTEDIGLFNEGFINSQVDKFKLKLQETTDAYGNFLFKIKNANLSNDVSNRLFENLSVVGKIGGIPQEQMDATVRNVGILLGEGVLEARHLRQLSYVHPQIVPFLADALGIKSDQKDEFSALFKQNIDDETAQQKLSQLISSGKLTKLGLNSNVIIEAFEKYRESIETKLPETLDLVQSKLNSLSVTWDRFKNSLILGQKPELAQLFSDLEKDIHWLTEHEEQIISVGKTIFNIAEAYAVWKLALLAMEAPMGIIGFLHKEQEKLLNILGSYTGKLSIQNVELTETENVLTSATEKQVVAYESMAVVLKDLNIQQELFNDAALAGQETMWMKNGLNPRNLSSSMSYSTGVYPDLWRNRQIFEEEGRAQSSLFTDAEMITMTAVQQQAYKYERLGLKEGSGGAAYLADKAASKGEGLIEGEGLFGLSSSIEGLGAFSEGVTFVGGGLLVALTTASILAIRELDKQNAQEVLDSNRRMNEIMLGETFDRQFAPTMKSLYDVSTSLEKAVYTITTTVGGDGSPGLLELLGFKPSSFSDGDLPFFPGSGHAVAKENYGKGLGLKLPEHHIRGNSSNYFTVNIHELNGIKQMEVKEGNKQDVENIKQIVGIELTRNMLEIINDIQVVRNGH